MAEQPGDTGGQTEFAPLPYPPTQPQKLANIMVVTKGPCFSLDARGTLGKSLTFAKVKKTNYAKKRFKPHNPKSAAQTAVRVHTKFITSLWQHLDDEYRQHFEQLAENQALSPYHAFIKFNMERWASGLAPAIELPTEESFPMTADMYSVQRSGRIWTVSSLIYLPDPSPVLVQVSASTSTPFTPGKNNTVAFIYPYIEQAANSYFAIGNWTAPDDQFYYFYGRAISIRGGVTPWEAFV